jgi:ubiquinone biosynthesis protein COQ9
MQQTRLLKLALPLVRTHGFTREALARSVLQLPAPKGHTDPLPDAAVSALFGSGDQARKTLIDAWLTEGIHQLQFVDAKASTGSGATVRELLRARLAYNEPVLGYLPEVCFSIVLESSIGAEGRNLRHLPLWHLRFLVHHHWIRCLR